MEDMMKREASTRSAIRDAEAYAGAADGVVRGDGNVQQSGRRLRSGRTVTTGVICSLVSLFEAKGDS